MNFLIWLLVGAVAGFLASLIFKKKKGLIWYLIIGLIGSFIGGGLFSLFNVSIGGIFGDIVAALIGALILLLIVPKLLKK